MSFGAFGSGGFGSVAFGGALGGSAISSIRIRALNALEVTLDGAIAISPALPDDPLNIASWSLSLYPGQSGAVPLVQYVEKVSDHVVIVYFDGPMTQNTLYNFAYVSAADPTFLMRVLTPAQVRAAQGFVDTNRYDLANPNLLADASGNVIALGTLQATDAGDYAIESGAKYLRKRLLRRLTTAYRSFLFLSNYGLAIPAKRIMRPSELQRFRIEALRQVKAEPDVRAAFVSVTQPEVGVLEIFVRVTMTTGQRDEFSSRINTNPSGG